MDEHRRFLGLFRNVDDLFDIGLSIKEELGLSETEFGLLVGTPILTGSLSRIFLGVWSDQFGGRCLFAL